MVFLCRSDTSVKNVVVSSAQLSFAVVYPANFTSARIFACGVLFVFSGRTFALVRAAYLVFILSMQAPFGVVRRILSNVSKLVCVSVLIPPLFRSGEILRWGLLSLLLCGVGPLLSRGCVDLRLLWFAVEDSRWLKCFWQFSCFYLATSTL